MTLKTITVIRHGEPYFPDQHGECLTDLGKKQYGHIARLYNNFIENKADTAESSGIVMCSPAVRCMESSEIVFNGSNKFKEKKVSVSLEQGERTAIFDEINKLDDNAVSHAVLITHQSNINIWKDFCKNGSEVGETMFASGIILEFNSWKDVTPRGLMKTKVRYSVSPCGIKPLQ